ncbi:hypothetical protein PIB30_110954, partial [Stylosanthes scabra]|nr:hypothetical protein [Stylosanthes scabra]
MRETEAETLKGGGYLLRRGGRQTRRRGSFFLFLAAAETSLAGDGESDRLLPRRTASLSSLVDGAVQVRRGCGWWPFGWGAALGLEEEVGGEREQHR